jgi:hypothetical protein
MYPGFEIEIKELIRKEIKAAFKELELKRNIKTKPNLMTGLMPSNVRLLGDGIFGGPKLRALRLRKINAIKNMIVPTNAGQ